MLSDSPLVSCQSTQLRPFQTTQGNVALDSGGKFLIFRSNQDSDIALVYSSDTVRQLI